VPAGAARIVAVVGDGASGLTAAQKVVDLIGSWQPDLVVTLGDVYKQGSAEEFSNWYGENGSYYNRFFGITNPSIGNHEYTTDPNARAYFDYWGYPPHYYSYTVGSWHFVSLDNTSQFQSSGTSSPQYQWLAADLQQNTAPCTVVAYHRPVYSVDTELEATDYSAYWRLLASHQVTMVLNGHSHNYQRWVPMDGFGTPSPSGVTEFVVGTGGQWISPFGSTDSRLAAGFDTTATAWGALRLELNPNGATYRFANIAGVTGDFGALACGLDTTLPTVPGGVKARAVSGREVSLSWQASTDDSGVQSYQVLRDGALLATVRGDQTTVRDTTVAAGTTVTYAVVAVDSAQNRSARSVPVSVATPAPSPTYVQAATNATGGRVGSMTIGLGEPVRAGDVLVGWFSEYDAAGGVRVQDTVNGPWTRVGGRRSHRVPASSRSTTSRPPGRPRTV